MNGQQTVLKVTELQVQTVQQWHVQPISNPYDGWLGVVCQQHQYNFLLWHEEDIARSPHVRDERIAQVKRAIDKYNQQRNDWIEKLDECLMQQLTEAGIHAPATVPLNTETPGSAIDRLSIMALRIYHMQEQLERTDVSEDHRANVQSKLDRCHLQHQDLSTALAELLDDLRAGRKQLKLYRQMKMYNDPALNPQVYQQTKRQPVT